MKKLTPKELNENVFSLIGDGWALAAACDTSLDGRNYNALTVSWGGMGVMWNKNVFWCFIRPQRYTKKFIDASDVITLSFFDEKYRDALRLCGTKSGRDCDKLALAGLDAQVCDDGSVTFRQARLTVKGRKLYSAPIKPEGFTDGKIVSTCYPGGDFHTEYVYEITDIELQ